MAQVTLSAARSCTAVCKDSAPIINDVKSLRKGIIKASKNEAHKPYTLLLIGETGTGKSSISEFIANVLAGNEVDHYDFNILKHMSEQRDSIQGQTNKTRLYECTSQSGVVVRILDTPGLTETRDAQQDSHNKKDIATQVEGLTDSITAVLVLANGTVPRGNGGQHHAAPILSTILPNTPASNIGLVLTNVAHSSSANFSTNNPSDVLKAAHRFEIDNPIALQKKYIELKAIKNVDMSEMQKTVKDAEQNGLEVLVNLFDWLDGLETQPTTKIIDRHEEPQTPKITNHLAQRVKGLLRKFRVFVDVLKVKYTLTTS